MTDNRVRELLWLGPSESVEMQILARWLDLAGVLWCHVPNGGKRHVGVARKLKAEGVKPGCPDILIFTPPPAELHRRGFAIELKRKTGGRVSPDQEQWLRDLRALNWVALIATGADVAIKYLEAWGYRVGAGSHQHVALDGEEIRSTVATNTINFDKIPF
jgi:hypothetical protein